VVTGGLEAVGDAITGALFGRAVEPAHGEGSTAGEGDCLNCGTVLLGQHCHACGQKAQVHRTLVAYGHDLLHGVFHFEGKVWKTLPMLVFKPGELTRCYIHGERAKFVSPLALFLFAVFLMFAVVGGLAGEMHMPSDHVTAALKNKPLAELEKGLKDQQARKAVLDTQIKAAEAADTETRALEKQRDGVEKEIDQIETARDVLTGKKWTVTEARVGWAKFDAAITKANENPNLFLYKLQSSAYKYSWALIPLSVPFVWLLFFWKRQYKVYDHAVFVTYSLTFMLFLVVVLTVIGFAGVGEPVVPIAGTFIPPIHIYKQMRGAYGVSRLGGLLRTILLGVFGTIVLSLFLVLLVAVGVFA
jgi:Protein of unknown function (DUF3667)